ncbi:uncharacterized protein LOC125226925 [Leguminivora glycinivorella]|uniref:uncharacterized protein LOC125226925 n=1 Tax=Leguminivora glycinivorella TaxID=1035111 RepID=UPI00200C0179|nr:uncharacterized protein LOC125226925 [Leguminivora glycinivorella]
MNMQLTIPAAAAAAAAANAAAAAAAANAAAAMSPLARSLLALATLLAASDAKITIVDIGLGVKCVKFIMDVAPRPGPYLTTRHGSKFTLMSQGHRQPLTIIPNKCALFNEEVSRQTVEVCNEFPTPYGPEPLPPTVHALADNLISPIFASCGDDNECGPLLWKIEQECRAPVQGALIASLK